MSASLLPTYVEPSGVYTFAAVCAAVADGTALFRSRDEQTRYAAHWAVLQREWACVGDYIKVRVFGFDAGTDAAGKRVAATALSERARLAHTVVLPGDGDECVAAAAAAVCVRLVDNDFPYHVETCVRHKLLWSLEPLEPSVVERLLAHFLGSQPRVWMLNGGDKQSIPAVFHAHVFTVSSPCEQSE